jgi:two-component system, response regulator, stage 0 sporulation protein F
VMLAREGFAHAFRALCRAANATFQVSSAFGGRDLEAGRSPSMVLAGTRPRMNQTVAAETSSDLAAWAMRRKEDKRRSGLAKGPCSKRDSMVPDTTNGSVTDGKQSIQRRRLLVVREDLGDLMACDVFFDSFSYEVVTCSSDEQAARSLQSEGFDLVLLNQGSPRLDWRGVLERAIAIDRHTPVLVITRSVDMSSYLDAMYLGALDYVEEPLTLPDIVRLIEAHLPLKPRASEPRKEHDWPSPRKQISPLLILRAL